jgi:3-oxoacyl-[acyl-carrier protein] reductase
MGRLDDRVAIVTGSGRGIGRATALRLARDGAAVVVNDLDEHVAIEVAKEIEDAGHPAIAVTGNCAHRREADHLVHACVREFGKLDILVNNAGTTRDKIFHQMDEDSLDVVLNANLRTTFNATQAAMPYLREVAKAEIKKHGRPAYNRKIVNTSSVVAFTGNPGQFNYTAAKGAVLSVTKTLARELGPFQINVNAVAPGFIETRMTAPHGSKEHLESGQGVPEATREYMRSLVSLGRLGLPEDIANVTAFLVSPDADYITGVTIPVTGGQFGGMG